MKKALLLSVAAAGFLALPGLAAAQEQPARPPMLFVYTDNVAPAHMAQYETAVKEAVGKVMATAEGAKLDWIAASGMGSWYLYAFPMQTMADMVTINQDWEAAVKAAGGPAIFAKSDQLVEYADAAIVAFRPDMSYIPANPSEAESAGNFRHWSFWHPLPGKAQELEAVAREFAELYRANNMGSGWRMYQRIIGSELPAYIVASTGMSPADYHSTSEAANATLGAEAEALFQKAFAITRRVETRDGMMRPDMAAGAFKK
ncbi:MAG: hypothetical protein HKM89_09700 [Gemmatimonadales bacterium]|nr:hypothetical protein [Gemmatimonadales bacterium]